MGKLIPIFCCPGRIRTLTGGTRIRRAPITPLDKFKFDAKVLLFFEIAIVLLIFLSKNAILS